MSNQKKRDDEKAHIAIGAGVFTVVLIVIDILFAGPLFRNGWIIPFIIIHLALIFSWGVVIAKFADPNYDYWRKYAIYVAIAGLVYVLGHLAYRQEKKSVIDDSNKAKQEATP